MKSSIYSLLTIVLFSVCFMACSDEDYTKNTTDESQERSVKIRLSLESEKPQTRAIEHILSDKDEEAIISLQLFIFRRDGERRLVKDYYFEDWRDENVNKTIEAYTGRFIYVFVANQFQEWTGITKYADIANKLYTITDESDISKGKSEKKALAAVFNKELLVPYPLPGLDVVELKDGTEPISLTRLCTKVLLNLKIDGITSDKEPLSDKLKIKSVQMKNASSAMYIFNENALDEHTTPAIHYPVRLFDANNKLDSIDDAFYILERKAHDNFEMGTYVEIVAEYRDMNSEVPTKLITYCAKFNTAPFEGDKYTGLFNVSRNQKYLLNVKITGTNDDDIRVEVEDLQKDGVFVSRHATGRGTGANWEDAFNTINEAIAFVTEYNNNSNHAPLTSIHVKEGTYEESIHIPDGLTIAGGFAGNLSGTNISDRNYSIKPILKSGVNNQPSSVVTFPATLTRPSALCYFIIEDGQAPMGGGVNMQSKHAILQACRVRNNQGEQGGGIYLSGGQVWNCIIDNNEASSNGAGIYIPNNAADAHIQNATIVANKWSGAIPTVAKGALFNIPSSGIYAASGAAATAHSCILYDNADENNEPSGVNYKFCAFSTDELLTWDQISNANIRIVSSNNVPSNQPFVTEVTNPGFKDDNSYQLSETSPLLSRGYVGKNNPEWNHPDFNGIQATNKKFPNIGATQGPKFRPYLDLYVKKQSFLPFKNAIINCFVASNIKDNQFEPGDIYWGVQEDMSDYHTPMQIRCNEANTSNKDQTRIGQFINNINSLRIELEQSHINFQLLPSSTGFNFDRNLYIMPESYENTSLELFSQHPMQYVVNTSVEPQDRTFSKIEYPGTVKWLEASEKSNLITYTNQSYPLALNAKNDVMRAIDLESTSYDYNFNMDGTNVKESLFPFSVKNQLTQVPEWILGNGSALSVLGLTESDYSVYFRTQKEDERGKFSIWNFNSDMPSLNPLSSGKANTAAALNQIRSATDYKWDTTNEELYQKTQNNAFIFCASLNPKVRKMLIENKDIIQESNLTWYVPSLNELKFISVFCDNSIKLASANYTTSTFGSNSIKRFNPKDFTESTWLAGSTNKLNLRCIRNSGNNSLYSGVTVINSQDSYIISSENMYSKDILAATGFKLVPDDHQLAAKFEIHPTNNNQTMSYADAQIYCASLNTDTNSESWRIPTQKEMMLMYLLKEQLKANGTFQLITDKEHFILQKNTISGINVFNYQFGKNSYYTTILNPQARVRCVRSIK